MVLKAHDTTADAPARDPRLSHDVIARRAFEISLTVDATPEENWAQAEAELGAELANCSVRATK